MVLHHAPPAQREAVRPAPGAGRGHGPRDGRRAAGGPEDRRPAGERSHPHVGVPEPRAVPVPDLLSGLSRRSGQGGRAHLRGRRRAVPRRPQPHRRCGAEAHRRLPLRGDRGRPGDGPRPDAALRREGPRQGPLGCGQLRAVAAAAGASGDRRRPVSAATGTTRAQLVQKARAFPRGAYRTAGGAALLLGAIVLLWGFAGGHGARVWQAWHFNLLFWMGLAQASVIFAATQKLAKGHWSGLVIRFAEAAVAFTPVALVLFLTEYLGRGSIYGWIHEPRPDVGAWLTPPWFFVRDGAIIALQSWLAWRFVRRDVAPDVRELASGTPAERTEDKDRISRDAAIFLVIWYGNLPEETYFIFYRLWGAWKPVGVAVFFLVFLIPFIGLLGAKPKKFNPTMLGFALTSLVGVWLERYLEVVPSSNGGAGPAIGIPELGVTCFFGGLYLLAIAWFAGRYPMLSPRLAADTLEREHH